MNPTDILKAKPLDVDISAYYDEEKKLYSICPVFPFLEKSTIDQAIEAYIDPVLLKKEVEAVYAYAKRDNSIIPNTDFLIALVDWDSFPQLIRLLSIIREWAFRNEGGGVGEMDTDEFDIEPEMRQLMILNPHYQEIAGAIVGGYRYMLHNKNSYERGPMGAHFTFSEEFKNQIWIELGRSFINPFYKEKDQKQSFDFVLHGLGYIYAKNPDALGYFGKVTLYHIYELQQADSFFLAVAKNYLKQSTAMWVNEEERVPEGILNQEQRDLLDKDIFKGLFLLLRKEFQVNIVPIMAVYNRMVDLDKMDYFGAFRHHEFGDTTEVGIAIAFDDIYDIIKEKFAKHYMDV